ncbi:MAG: zinc dependent phospholipase C family protein [Bacteroidetes bacterium]|nr:zinc dependent phospholipase C family protein [Bacteroidota bacterium]
MKKNYFVLVFIFFIQSAFSWGFWAHKKITSEAINLLPEKMREFYINYNDSIVNGSIAADLRRNKDKLEAARHYIDFEYYDEYPFAKIPFNFEEAKKLFGDSLINSSGYVPWQIVDVTKKLENAFREKNAKLILFYSSDLAHYIADAHVPLHTTKNYDGQLTNQHGLHARWESEIPEKYFSLFKLNLTKPEIITNFEEASFKICFDSYANVEKSLKLDKESWNSLSGEANYKKVENNGKQKLFFNKNYYDIYYEKLDGMVERRMEKAIINIANFWYSAWVNAGKPILNI